MRADLIAVLDNGCIVELGTHAQLLAANGVYANLVRAAEHSNKHFLVNDDKAL